MAQGKTLDLKRLECPAYFAQCHGEQSAGCSARKKKFQIDSTCLCLVASLIPLSAFPQASELRSTSRLLAFHLQIIRQLPQHEHPERADVGVHLDSLGRFLGPSRGLIGAKSEG